MDVTMNRFEEVRPASIDEVMGLLKSCQEEFDKRHLFERPSVSWIDRENLDETRKMLRNVLFAWKHSDGGAPCK
jgi:hypothetical protein